MSEDQAATTFDVAPSASDWYYCAVIDRFGETDYIDGYASGARPTAATLRASLACAHSWVAGMMHVHAEDLDTVSAVRQVTCEQCDAVYGKPLPATVTIIEFSTQQTSSANRASH